MKVITINIPESGNRSYIVHDNEVAIVIDPSRRYQQIIDAANATGINVGAVFETHIHNDYISGGYSLAKKLNVPYYISSKERVIFKRKQIEHGQCIKVGSLKVTALASPGHTHHHLSYLVEQPEAIPLLFSGGSLLYGSVGRTDLVSAEATRTLAKAQYDTAQYYANYLDPSTGLYPTHGFGSFCAVSETEDESASTIKHQLITNPVYTTKNKSKFVKDLISQLDDYPSYYVYMAPENLKGPLEARLDNPKLLTKESVMKALHAGAAIVDMRSRLVYAASHLRGTFNIELNDSLATYVGWLLAWDTPLILVATTAKEVVDAQEQLSLIGREILFGQIRPTKLLGSSDVSTSFPARKFTDLAKNLKSDGLLILDVRRRLEWQKSHIKSAVHIPLHQLSSRLNEINLDKDVWVYCDSGFRASIGASMISGTGRRVVLVNDNYDEAIKLGLAEADKKSAKIVRQVLDGNAQLLDVRNNSEWKTRHAKNAIHISLPSLLSDNTDALIKNTPIYIYCESGNRASMAESFLSDQGFEAINIGGLNDWVAAGGVTVES